MTKNHTELSAHILNFLNDTGTGIKHPGGKRLTLDDIFVYPQLLTSHSLSGSVFSSCELLNTSRLSEIILITGPENSGKTSLLKTLMKGYSALDFLPVFIDSNRTGHIYLNGLGELIRSSYESQYSENHLKSVITAGKQKKICLIDNIPGRIFERAVLSELLNEFGCLILFTSSPLAGDVITSLISGKTSLGCFEISELGPEPIREICRKWHSISIDSDSPEAIKQRDTNVESSVQTIEKALSHGLAPSYPIIILTILQRESDDSENPPRSCTYVSFIEHIVMKPLKETVAAEELERTHEALSKIAFEMFTGARQGLTEPELTEILGNRAPDAISTLFRTGTLIHIGRGVEFKYMFSYYYFTASHIARNLVQEEVREKAASLCNGLGNEDSANILLFLTYLSDDPLINEEITKALEASHSGFTPESIEDRLNELDKLIQSIIVAGDKDKKLKELRAEYSSGKERVPGAFVTAHAAYEYKAPSEAERLIENIEHIQSDLGLLRASCEMLKKKLFENPDSEKTQALGKTILNFWLRSLSAALERLVISKEEHSVNLNSYDTRRSALLKSEDEMRILSDYRVGIDILTLYIRSLSEVPGMEPEANIFEAIRVRPQGDLFELIDKCARFQKTHLEIWSAKN